MINFLFCWDVKYTIMRVRQSTPVTHGCFPLHKSQSAQSNEISTSCPVCRSPSPEHFLLVDGRDYFRCEICQARFADPQQRPGPGEERVQYLLHENDPDDPRYRKFLTKFADPFLDKLTPNSRGLDFGCGPGPALAMMMREAGHEMALYDPFFHQDREPLSKIYDFITCTEAAEHFHSPAEMFKSFDALLRPGGWLGVMTCFQTDDALFANWHYRKDPTHVVFYREATFEWLSERRGWTCEFPVKDVALMRKRV